MKVNNQKIRIIVLLAFLIFSSTGVGKAQELAYELSFSEPQAHYVDVKMEIRDLKKEFIDIKMPVWAPGSYLVREFAKNVEGLTASGSSGQSLPAEKIRKNTWRIASGGDEQVTVEYRVYAFEISVRTSYVDTEHAYLNGSSVFMFIDDLLDLPATLTIIPHGNWKKVSTGLEMVNGDPFIRKSPDYDILADSPIEIGNQDVIEFTAAGSKHEIAIYGRGKYDKERMAKDFTRIIEEQVGIFDDNPNDYYLFIVHFLDSGGGGLEHLNSTTLQFPRERIGTAAGYAGFLELAAHEYFHLWNVKRLRPYTLGPFDYDRENYTRMLWVVEGFTSYYDKWTLVRTGDKDPEAYLKDLAAHISYVENIPGNKIQTVSEASYDAWIKFYRPDENSSNSTVSYYSKGSVLGVLIDMAIRKHTKGEKNLDDLMKYVYDKYYKEEGRGYKDGEFKAAVEKFAGNMDEFWGKYVNGTETPDYSSFFEAVGLKMIDVGKDTSYTELGAKVAAQGNYVFVNEVVRGTAAWEQGVSANDIILSVDGQRVKDLKAYVAAKKPGDSITVQVIRNGLPKTIDITLGKSRPVAFRLVKVDSPTALQKKNYSRWLKINGR